MRIEAYRLKRSLNRKIRLKNVSRRATSLQNRWTPKSSLKPGKRPPNLPQKLRPKHRQRLLTRSPRQRGTRLSMFLPFAFAMTSTGALSIACNVAVFTRFRPKLLFLFQPTDERGKSERKGAYSTHRDGSEKGTDYGTLGF